MSNQAPVIIVLNGASSSGKTLTSAALVKLLGSNCIVTGFDDILERVQPFGAEGTGSLSSVKRILRIIAFQITDGRIKLFRKLHREIVATYQAGHTVIVETSLMDERALQDAAMCFSSTNAFFIGMKPPLEVSETWEAKRSDRAIGQARKHYHAIHAHGNYDLILDPSTMSPEECARRIINHINQSQPIAFRTIAQKLHENTA